MPSPTPRVSTALLARRAAALLVYNDLHTCDGVTPTAWAACARELADIAAELATELELTSASADAVAFVADRAKDAGHEAVACARRLDAAIARYTGIQATEGRRAVCS